jgi:hypothetical protein
MNDNELTFFSAMLYAMEREDPSKAIEDQEKRGQQTVIRECRLPKKTNDHTVPREISMQGVKSNMSYEERRNIVDHNIFAYTREQYEKMGIKILDAKDDLFWTVILPEGWTTKATDHTMWNELRDDQDRVRGTFFYKAAFYDRDAFINFETRFQIEVTHDCDPEADYQIWKKADLVGIIKDAGKIVYRTKTVPAIDDYDKELKIKNKLYDELEAYLEKEYPDYKNIHAYWND